MEDAIVKCKLCGSGIAWKTKDGELLGSNEYIEGSDFCKSCMVEHCLTTNCLGCIIGTYPGCRFSGLKKEHLKAS